MLRLDLQFFASKKGVGSTRNGRDSHSNVLAQNAQTDSLLLAAQSFIVSAERKFIQVKTSVAVVTILFSQKLTASFVSNVLVVTKRKLAYTLKLRKLNIRKTGRTAYEYAVLFSFYIYL